MNHQRLEFKIIQINNLWISLFILLFIVHNGLSYKNMLISSYFIKVLSLYYTIYQEIF